MLPCLPAEQPSSWDVRLGENVWLWRKPLSFICSLPVPFVNFLFFPPTSQPSVLMPSLPSICAGGEFLTSGVPSTTRVWNQLSVLEQNASLALCGCNQTVYSTLLYIISVNDGLFAVVDQCHSKPQVTSWVLNEVREKMQPCKAGKNVFLFLYRWLSPDYSLWGSTSTVTPMALPEIRNLLYSLIQQSLLPLMSPCGTDDLIQPFYAWVMSSCNTIKQIPTSSRVSFRTAISIIVNL